MKKLSLLICVLVLASVSVFAGGGSEESYPSKQVSLVVQANPGGLSDQVSRKVGELMSKELGVPVVAVYKPGAIGATAFEFVKNSKADGYTFGHVPIEISMVRTLGYANTGIEDFTALGQAYITVPVIAVGKNSEYDSFEEMVAAAKKNPNTITIGTAGAGSFWHMAAVGLENELGGAKFKFVPFEGSAPAVAALLGGHVDAVVAGPIEVLSNIEAGDIIPLVAISTERSEVLADTPTTVELGYDFGSTHWGGFVAPPGVPEDVASVLQDAFKKAIESEEFGEFMAGLAMEAHYRSPDEFSEFAQNAEGELASLIEQVNSGQ